MSINKVMRSALCYNTRQEKETGTGGEMQGDNKGSRVYSRIVYIRADVLGAMGMHPYE